MKKTLIVAVLVLILAAAGFICIRFYGNVFSKTIKGEIVKVERVNQAGTVIATGQAVPASQLHSYAVAIRDEKNEIHTASTEDRQWAVAQSGQCVEALFLPYAPWELDKAGTFHGARLLRLYDCKKP